MHCGITLYRMTLDLIAFECRIKCQILISFRVKMRNASLKELRFQPTDIYYSFILHLNDVIMETEGNFIPNVVVFYNKSVVDLFLDCKAEQPASCRSIPAFLAL